MWFLASLPLCYGIWKSCCDAERAGAGSQWLYLTTCSFERLPWFLRVPSCPLAKLCSKVLPLTTGTQLGGAKHWQSPQRLASPAHCGQDDISYLLQPGQTSVDTRTFQCLSKLLDFHWKSTHLQTSSRRSFWEFYAARGWILSGSIMLTLPAQSSFLKQVLLYPFSSHEWIDPWSILYSAILS